MESNIIFDFNKKSDLKKWVIIDDIVMGGKSSGSIELSPQGHGVFKGKVSLDNYGGFSSVRNRFQRKWITDFTKIVLKIKGDGKNYQFRMRANSDDYYAYIYKFTTNGDWQEIDITIKNMYPSFRGRKLDKPNFSEDYIEEIAFLIANKNEERFKLLINKIELI